MALWRSLRDKLTGRAHSAERLRVAVEALAEMPERWGSADVQELEGLLYMQCFTYGVKSDPAMVSGLEELYSVARHRLSTEARLRVLITLAEAAEQRRISSNALLPFIYSESSQGVITTAVLNTAVLFPCEAADPLAGPKRLLVAARESSDERIQVGILCGLMLLGDRRVLELIRASWRMLTPEGRKELAGAWSGFAHAPVIDFFIEWLEDSEGGEFGAVAGALSRIPLNANPPFVLAGC
jgi:hypothetical protein